MIDFDNIKNIWQQSSPAIPAVEVLKKVGDTRQKLMQQQLRSGMALLATFIIIGLLGINIAHKFEQRLTVWAMVAIAIIPLVQGVINLFVYAKLKAISPTQAPAGHLQSWQQYHLFRKKMIRINGPVYFILLNLGFVFYFLELLAYFSWPVRIAIIVAYSAWMLYAYFVMGKKNIQKENRQIEETIAGLQNVAEQLTE